MYDDVQFHTVSETGLKLPDGTLIFPPDTWHGRGVETNDDRAVIVSALRESAVNLGIAETELLDRYKWHVRDKQTITVTRRMDGGNHDLDDPSLIDIANAEAPSEPPSESHE